MSSRLLLLTCVVIWGWTFVATKILLDAVNPIELTGLRFGLGLPILFVLVRAKRIPLAFTAKDLLPLGLGAVLICYHFLVQPLGLETTTATNTGWIIAVTPLALALLSALLLRERVGKGQILGIAIASSGIVLLISRGDVVQLWGGTSGDWLVLSTAFSWALFTIATRDLSRRRPALAVTLAVFLPVTLLCLGYIALHSGLGVLDRMSARAWVALVFLASLGTLAQWLWQIGVARLGAAHAGMYLYLEPLATTALAVPLLGEEFGLRSACGGALVLLGVWQAERKQR